MVSPPTSEKGLIYDIKVSSIGPADVTGANLIYEPRNVDLAMKLHYLRGIYYFRSEAFEGLTTLVIKEPMFMWLNQYPMTCGRFRRADSGRPYIKCNDCGVRLIEGKCQKTLDEWLETKDAAAENHLVPNQVLGPELGFSPLIFIQLTKFKCGGMGVGLSWAHVLGDAFSAAEFMNTLGRAVAGQEMGEPINLSQTATKSMASDREGKDPLSVKRVEAVGDNWVYGSKVKMEAFSFTITPTHVEAKVGGAEFTPFDALSALIWRCIARIRGKEEANTVTICKGGERDDGGLSNSQVVSVVKADFPIGEAELSKVASLLKSSSGLEENNKIDEAMEREEGSADFIIYGANLTFVDLQGPRFYEFEYRGQKPVHVSYRIDGVGEQGAVIVLPNGTVTAILAENEIDGFKQELRKEGVAP